MIVVNARFLTQQITGSQRFAIEISKSLKKIDPGIVFISPQNIIHERLSKELEAITVGVNRGHLWEQIDLPLYLKMQGNPLLLNLVNTAPLGYNNMMVTIHDLAWIHFPKALSKSFYLWYKFIVPRIARKAKHIFTVSNFSRDDIGNRLSVNKSNITVINNAIRTVFRKKEIKKEKIILSVATMQYYKNMKGVIDAFILSKEQKKINSEYKLYLVGGVNKGVFKSIDLFDLGRRKDIFFTGYITDEELVDLYNKSQLFVLASKFEGFGIPPLEAMACGCPVVVSNVAALPEVCGDAAYYVNPYDVEDIARGIHTVLSDENLQKELVRKGFERVKLFSWEKSSKKLIEVIEEVLQN